MRYATCVSVTLLSIVVTAQSQVSTPRFEVASIKRSDGTASGGRIGREPGGRFVMVNGVIANLIRTAYPSVTSEVFEAPQWVSVDRYDVTAIGSPGASETELQLMMRTLLTERFKLAAHYESRDTPVWALVLARQDGRLGPQIRKSPVDCDAVKVARAKGQAIEVARPSNNAQPCGYQMSGTSTGLEILSGGATMATLARSLGRPDGRPVLDRTGLAGYYEYSLEQGADRLTAAGSAQDRTDEAGLFTALQEQLGLKLESRREPVDVIVVDSIEQPSPD